MNAMCEDCNNETQITLAPYGTSFMAEINCPECGVSYDTNLDEQEIVSIIKSMKPMYTDEELEALLKTGEN